jgi:NitT/TauT family transport system ATP-binding protein
VVRPGVDRSGSSDEIRRDPAYLDWVEQIWHELRGYLER